MVETKMPSGDRLDSPDNTIPARVSPLTEVQLRIAEERVRGIVVIEVDGLLPGVRVVLALNHALDLSLRLTEACGRLMKAKIDQPSPG